MIMISNKIQVIKHNYKGRQDVFAKHWKTKDGQKAGFSPVCYNEWKKGLCSKPCHTCENSDYVPLSDSHLLDHLKGKSIYGIYPLLPDNTCHFIAADFDNHRYDRNPLNDVKMFHEVCAVQGVPCYILRSKSGVGYHVYIFFEWPIPAWKARRVVFGLLQEAGVIGDELESQSFDRLFPNQDKLTGRGFGNLIALPFQGKASKKGHTLFLDPETGFEIPSKNQFEILSNINRASEKQFDELITSWNLEVKDVQEKMISHTYDKAITELNFECEFIKWCRKNPADVSEPLWYALISNLISIRPGGYSLCHDFSKGYPSYTKEETDNKIRHAIDSTRPHTCQFIFENGFRCSKRCGVKSPVGLIRREQNG